MKDGIIYPDSKGATERSKDVAKLFENPFALQINQNGTPKHPLYVKSDIQPVKYKLIEINPKR